MLNLNNIHPEFHPVFAIYKAEQPKPLYYTVSSFDFNDNEHYFTVYYDSETIAEVGETIIPKSKVNDWFKSRMPDEVKAYSYKEDGEDKVNWDHLYMDKFDIGCNLITVITNDYINGRI